MAKLIKRNQKRDATPFVSCTIKSLHLCKNSTNKLKSYYSCGLQACQSKMLPQTYNKLNVILQDGGPIEIGMPFYAQYKMETLEEKNTQCCLLF